MAVAQLKPHLVERPEPEIEFNCLPHIAEGPYSAYCKKVSKYWDRFFKRWVCLFRFDVLDDNQETIAEICYFLNLGSNQQQPYAGTRSKIYREWCRAAGKRPNRHDRFSLRIFEKRMATIRVRDTKKNHQQESVPADSCYSVVGRIESWDTGASTETERDRGHQQISQSTNQLSTYVTASDNKHIQIKHGKSSCDLGRQANQYMKEYGRKVKMAEAIASDQKLKRQFDAGAYELDRDGSE